MNTPQATTTNRSEAYKVTARLISMGVSFPNDKTSKTIHNRFRVTVTTERGRASFDFYDSQANYQAGVTELTDLDGALECFLMDASAGSETFEDFCANFGYDTDSRSAYKIYKACVKSKEKAERIFTDFCEVLNELTNQ